MIIGILGAVAFVLMIIVGVGDERRRRRVRRHQEVVRAEMRRFYSASVFYDREVVAVVAAMERDGLPFDPPIVAAIVMSRGLDDWTRAWRP